MKMEKKKAQQNKATYNDKKWIGQLILILTEWK